MGKLNRKTTKKAQGETVLGTARTMYLIAAVLSLVVVVAGIIAALFFHTGTWQQAKEIPLPSEYTPSTPTLNADDVAKLLEPPNNIQFVVTEGTIHAPINDRTILGYFTADTANGLASYPGDFDILGGKDAVLFDRTRTSKKRAGLQATKELVDQIKKVLPTLLQAKMVSYELKVIARDKFGAVSKPETISFSLTFAPPQSSETASEVEEIPMARLTELQRLARNIALTVDPKKTPAYFDAYKRAQKIPKTCGTSDSDMVFISSFRSMFDQLRSRLTATNVEAFYIGVCSEWKRALAMQKSAQREAKEERDSVISQNRAAEIEAGVKRGIAETGRNISISVVGGALSVFLVISLFLAFLAIENHTRAVREAVEVLSKNSALQEDDEGNQSGASP